MATSTQQPVPLRGQSRTLAHATVPSDSNQRIESATTDEMVEFDRVVQGDDDDPFWYRTGDVVLLAAGDDSDRVALAEALERTGFCDMAHVVSDGVYLDE